MYLVYCMTCEDMLGQCCPNANGIAGLRAGGLRAECLRAEGLPAETVKHEWLRMYDNFRECMIVYRWGFLLSMLVSALLGNTFLFRLSRTRPFEIGALPCSGVSVTTHEVTCGTHVVNLFDHRVLCDLEDRRRRLIYRGEFSQTLLCKPHHDDHWSVVYFPGRWGLGIIVFIILLCVLMNDCCVINIIILLLTRVWYC